MFVYSVYLRIKPNAPGPLLLISPEAHLIPAVLLSAHPRRRAYL